MSALVLPSYSPSAAPPEYSPQPSGEDRSLDHNPRFVSQTLNGSFVKKSRQLSLVLKDQDEAAQLPTYGRNALISGEVTLQDTRDVHSVVLKVCHAAPCLCHNMLMWRAARGEYAFAHRGGRQQDAQTAGRVL